MSLALALPLPLGCINPARSDGTVVYASGADLESANPLVTIHPLSRQVQRYALLVTLARYDRMLEPEPYAATRWDWSSDRRTLTFHLARGLSWHDGVPTTAHDAAFTLDAARDPATGYPRYADLADVSATEAADDSTLVVRFVSAQPHFPAVLCELPIVPRHLLASTPRAAMRRAAFNLAPVGNGPFRFVDRRPAERWVFERNPGFPAELGGPPSLQRLVVVVVDEATTKFAGLVSGDLDVAGISPAMAPLTAADPALRVLEYPALFAYAIVFNAKKAPFNDPRVRRAISLSIDRERIVKAALGGYATPATGPVSPDHPFVAADGVSRDTVLADSLFDAAGWQRDPRGARRLDDRALTLDLLTVGSGDNAAEQMLQGDLAARGVRVEIVQREMASFLAEARARDKSFDALFTGIPGDVSLAHLTGMYDTRIAGGALDYGGYHTRRLDSLLSAARSATSETAARLAWTAVQRELRSEMPAVWVYHARGLQGLSRRLQGVTMDLRGEMVSIARWRLADPSRVALRPP